MSSDIVFALMRIKKRRYCIRIQRFLRVRLERWRKREKFAELLCGEGGVFRFMKLRFLVQEWHRVTETQKMKLVKGIEFTARRAGMRYNNGECKIFLRLIRLFESRICVYNADTDALIVSYDFSELKFVSQGESEHNKRNIELRLNNGIVESYQLSNPWGFLATFELQWVKYTKKQKSSKPREIFTAKLAIKKEIDYRPKKKVSLPTPKESEMAVGDLSELTRPMQKLYSFDGDRLGLYSLTQAPWRGEWLDMYPEHVRGQTYDEWINSDPDVPAGNNRCKLYFVGLDDFDEVNGAPEMRHLVDFAKSYFYGLQVGLLPPMPNKGLYKTSGREAFINLKTRLTTENEEEICALDGMQVCQYLKKFLPHDGYVLLAVTLRDIYIDDCYTNGCYISSLPEFREYTQKNRVGVISLSRIDPWFGIPESFNLIRPKRYQRKTLLLRRSCILIAQQIMRLFGMANCVWHSCCMNGFVNIEEAALIPLQACPVCLRKLQHALSIKTIVRTTYRYNDIRIFCHINHRTFKREVNWYGTRSRLLENEQVKYYAQLEIDKLNQRSSIASEKRKRKFGKKTKRKKSPFEEIGDVYISIQPNDGTRLLPRVEI